MIPTDWARDWLSDGELVPVGPRAEHDLPLHWLSSRLPSRTLDVLTRCVTARAKVTLIQ